MQSDNFRCMTHDFLGGCFSVHHVTYFTPLTSNGLLEMFSIVRDTCYPIDFNVWYVSSVLHLESLPAYYSKWGP